MDRDAKARIDAAYDTGANWGRAGCALLPICFVFVFPALIDFDQWYDYIVVLVLAFGAPLLFFWVPYECGGFMAARARKQIARGTENG